MLQVYKWVAVKTCDNEDSDDDESNDEDNLETEKGVERPKRRKGCPLNVKANCIRYNKDRNQNIL